MLRPAGSSGLRAPARPGPGPRPRRGVAAAELAVLLPLLCLMALATVDFGRIMRVQIVLMDAARNGAYRASQGPNVTDGQIQQTALAGTGDLSPAPTVEVTRLSDIASRRYVRVTVRTTFRPLSPYPGIRQSIPISRSAVMYDIRSLTQPPA